MLELRLLGRFDFQLEGRPVELPSRAAQSLLSYLALTAGRAHRRERLAGLIWPDVVEANARRNLRQALWQIRSALRTAAPTGRAPDVLLADDIHVAFDGRAAFSLDAARLDAPLNGPARLETLIDMVGVYEGELLPGFYDDWVVPERERLQAVFERKIKLLVLGLSAGRQWSEVIYWAERWIRLAHAPEAAYAALLQAHAALGDPYSLATTYRRCVEALRRDLGEAPAEATRALYEQLLRAQPLPASPPAHPLPGQPTPPALGEAAAWPASLAWDSLLLMGDVPLLP
jgi:DNA-binding SARP family transcriptional activator